MRRIVLAAAGAAVVGMAACSHPAAPASVSGNHGTSSAQSGSGSAAGSGGASVPVSCGQQYRAWEQGPGRGLIAAIHAVSVAGTASDPQVLTVALEKAQPAVARGTRHPVPACADPRGYWNVLLMHVNAAVASRSSASSVRAAMQDVPKIENELTAELKGTSR